MTLRRTSLLMVALLLLAGCRSEPSIASRLEPTAEPSTTPEDVEDAFAQRLVEPGEIVVVALHRGATSDSLSAPWQLVEMEDTLILADRRTGESRTVPLRNWMAPIGGVGRVPGLRFVWANAGGVSGARNELNALVIDTVTGDSHEFLEAIDGGFIGPPNISLSADAAQAIAVSAEA